MKKALLMIVLLLQSPALFAGMSEKLAEIQKAWAVAKYQTPESEQEKAFEALAGKARKLVADHPDHAEPKVWLAIVLSTEAGVNGGLSALGLVKEARSLLEAAEQIDPDVLDGSVYTSLGSLYYQVPGWPLAFGDDEKAEAYLRKALKVNPQGIDANYFYGDFLLSDYRPKEAIKYLRQAKAAPPRPQRPIADAGRHKEIEAALAKAQQMLDREDDR